ncbi:MAG: zinc ABC transporter substrate-binding protein [Dichotomicrobium sp.]
MFKLHVFALAFFAVALSSGAPPANAEPAIAVSIKPVHSLVAGVTRGVSEPYLLIPGSASPHTYSLKPSDAQALEDTDLVFWIGPDLETVMTGPLEALADEASVVALADTPGVTLLPVREGDDWDTHEHHGDDGHAHEDEHEHDHAHDEEHSHEHEHGDAHDHGDEHADDHGEHTHAHGETDMHIWLDPQNAKAMVAHIVNVLREADPANAATYDQNGAEITAQLDALTAELRDTLAPVKDEPFFVFHDAYQYFELAFGLNAAGAITVSPDIQPGAQHLREIGEKLGKAGANCIFAEPQFTPKLIEVVTEGTDARSGVLDPVGADIAAGPDMYFTLMRRNARALRQCLSADG